MQSFRRRFPPSELRRPLRPKRSSSHGEAARASFFLGRFASLVSDALIFQDNICHRLPYSPSARRILPKKGDGSQTSLSMTTLYVCRPSFCVSSEYHSPGCFNSLSRDMGLPRRASRAHKKQRRASTLTRSRARQSHGSIPADRPCFRLRRTKSFVKYAKLQTKVPAE